MNKQHIGALAFIDTLSWLTTNNEKQVSCPSHVRPPGMQRGIQVKPVVTLAANPGSGCRCHGYHAGCCRKGPWRQRISTAWGIGSCWVDGKAVATQRDGQPQPITAQRVTMHNVIQQATVLDFLIFKLCWNINQSGWVLGIWMNMSVFSVHAGIMFSNSKKIKWIVKVRYCTVYYRGLLMLHIMSLLRMSNTEPLEMSKHSQHSHFRQL